MSIRGRTYIEMKTPDALCVVKSRIHGMDFMLLIIVIGGTGTLNEMVKPNGDMNGNEGDKYRRKS